MKIKGFITHKLKENFTDCQDRFSVNPVTKSIAVSDGMSQSWQQKIWAQLLVEKFVDSIDWQPNHETIKPLCTHWCERVVEFIEHLKASEAPVNLVYRNERNLADGKSAGATFVGIRFVGIKWKGTVLGDSCLIEWNGDEANFYTSQNVDTFDNHPDYFDSNILNEGKGDPINICGVLESSTILFLVSDPFSDFLLEHKKQGNANEYMQQLLKLSSHKEFEALVGKWRKIGMHNDDTTLVIVEPDDSDEFSIDTNTLDDINKLIDEEKKQIEEKKKEEAEQMPVSESNMQIESEADTNAIVEEVVQIQQPEKHIESSQTIVPSDNAIEEKKKEEAEQMPVSESNMQIESEADTNAIVEEVVQIQQPEKHIESSQTIVPSDNAIEEKKKEEAEQMPVSESNMQIESEADTNAIVEEVVQIQQPEKHIESSQTIVPSDNAIEEKKKEEAEQMPVSESNMQIESEADTNAIVEEVVQIQQPEKHIESSQTIVPSDNIIEEHMEDEEEQSEFVPVEAKAFVDELLSEYKNNTDGGILDSLKYTFTEEAVKKAGYSIFKKYNIFNK